MESVDFKYVKTRRDDVSQTYFGKVYDEDYGFDIKFDYKRGDDYYLEIAIDKQKKRIKYNEELIYKRSSVAYKRMEKLKDLCNMETVRVAMNFMKKNGLRALIRKSKSKIQGMDNDYEYAEWYEKTKPTKEELNEQRDVKFDYSPLFSIVVPLYATPDNFLGELLDSILNQTYQNFEVCLADGSEGGKDKEEFIKKYIEEKSAESKIKYKKLGKNLGIAGNTNEALKMATGDYIVLADHDDVITPNALYECAKAINETGCDCMYSDEDKLDMDGGSLFDPHFKPDFNIDMLESVNYICHLFVVKKELVDTAGMFDAAYDGAQDYDFILRMSENSRKVGHVSKILYHWRTHINSTAANPESKMYAFKAGAEAIKAHYARVLPNIKIKDVVNGESLGIYHTIFAFEEYPLISVIIPNKDHTEDLDKAIRSMMEKGTWPNLEFIVIENNSTEEKTWVYYEKIQKEYPQVKVVKYNGEFNYSKINNFGVQYATGGYYLFMNNDVELIEPDSLQELMGYAQREDVGAVGCRLLYEDDTIQHAGVIIGIGVADHAFKHQLSYGTYFNRAMVTQDLSAVTAAVMLVRKEVYEKVAGFGEDFAVAFNDIDFCLKIRQAGYLVVYAAYGCFHHYESKSRGEDDTSAKMERFQEELSNFNKKWKQLFEDGDPYYNSNLTITNTNYDLKRL